MKTFFSKLLTLILFAFIVAGVLLISAGRPLPGQSASVEETALDVSDEPGIPLPDAPQEAPVTPSPEPTPELTPEPTPEPTPVPAIPYDAGKHLLKYEDPDTGYWLDYVVYVPEIAEPGMPLLTFLHGDGYVGAAEYLKDAHITEAINKVYGEEFPFILLMPNTRISSWESDNIPQTVFDLIELTADEFFCDRDRIMLTGHSRGAIAVWNYISINPELFSCAVPVSCCNDLPFDAEKAKSVPLRAFVADYFDDYPRYGNDMEALVGKLNAAGGDAKLTILNNISHSETQLYAYTAELFEWMLAQ